MNDDKLSAAKKKLKNNVISAIDALADDLCDDDPKIRNMAYRTLLDKGKDLLAEDDAVGGSGGLSEDGKRFVDPMKDILVKFCEELKNRKCEVISYGQI